MQSPDQIGNQAAPYFRSAHHFFQTLPHGIQSASHDLQGSYLIGPVVTQCALIYYGNESASITDESYRKPYHFFISPGSSLRTIAVQNDVIEHKIFFERKYFGKTQSIRTPPRLDIYFYAHGRIQSGEEIGVTWTETPIQSSILCTAQCFFNPTDNTFIFRDKTYFKLFKQKKLHSAEWNVLFEMFQHPIDEQCRIWAEKRINLIFRIFLEYLAEDWTIDLRDQAILRKKFSDPKWRATLNASFNQPSHRKMWNDAIDLGDLLSVKSDVTIEDPVGIPSAVATPEPVMVIEKKETAEAAVLVQTTAHEEKTFEVAIPVVTEDTSDIVHPVTAIDIHPISTSDVTIEDPVGIPSAVATPEPVMVIEKKETAEAAVPVQTTVHEDKTFEVAIPVVTEDTSDIVHPVTAIEIHPISTMEPADQSVSVSENTSNLVVQSAKPIKFLKNNYYHAFYEDDMDSDEEPPAVLPVNKIVTTPEPSPRHHKHEMKIKRKGERHDRVKQEIQLAEKPIERKQSSAWMDAFKPFISLMTHYPWHMITLMVVCYYIVTNAGVSKKPVDQFVPPEDLCFNAYEQVGGNVAFTNAQMLFINVVEGDDSFYHCVFAHHAQKMFVENITLGVTRWCGSMQCDGMDYLSSRRRDAIELFRVQSTAYKTTIDLIKFESKGSSIQQFIPKMKQLMSSVQNTLQQLSAKLKKNPYQIHLIREYGLNSVMLEYAEFFIQHEVRTQQEYLQLFHRFVDTFAPPPYVEGAEDMLMRVQHMEAALTPYAYPPYQRTAVVLSKNLFTAFYDHQVQTRIDHPNVDKLPPHAVLARKGLI